MSFIYHFRDPHLLLIDLYLFPIQWTARHLAAFSPRFSRSSDTTLIIATPAIIVSIIAYVHLFSNHRYGDHLYSSNLYLT